MKKLATVFFTGMAFLTLFGSVQASALYMPPGTGGSVSGGLKVITPENFTGASYRYSRCPFLGTTDGYVAGFRLSLTARYGTTLRLGSTGGCVQDVQHYLNVILCSSSTQLSEDGYYGNKTKAAVMRLQQVANSYGLKQVTDPSRIPATTTSISVDGIYGKQSYLATKYVDVLYSYPKWLGIDPIPRFSCQ